MNGTCNSGYSGTGTCNCSSNWTLGATGVCNACAPGRFGSLCTGDHQTEQSKTEHPEFTINLASLSFMCTGQCPDCHHGTCNDGVTGPGTCSCESGWGSNGTDHCASCLPGYTQVDNSCTLCHASCAICNGTGFDQCLSCKGSLSFDSMVSPLLVQFSKSSLISTFPTLDPDLLFKLLRGFLSRGRKLPGSVFSASEFFLSSFLFNLRRFPPSSSTLLKLAMKLVAAVSGRLL